MTRAGSTEVRVATVIDDALADVVVELLRRGRGETVLVIDSPGGSVPAGLRVYDAIVEHGGVRTRCVGRACSMAAVLLAAGKPGEREIVEGGRVMIHRATTAPETDVIAALLAEGTERPWGIVYHDMESERHFTAEEAVAYGLADRVVRAP